MLVYDLPRQEKGLQIQKRLRTSAPNKTNLSIASTSLLPSEQVRGTSKELKTYNLLFHDLCTSFSAFHSYLKIIVGLKNMYTCKSLFFWTDLNQSFQAQHLGVSFGGQSLLWGEWPSGPAEKVESTVRTSNPYKWSGFERGSQDLSSFLVLLGLCFDLFHVIGNRKLLTSDGPVVTHERECGPFIPLIMGW